MTSSVTEAGGTSRLAVEVASSRRQLLAPVVLLLAVAVVSLLLLVLAGANSLNESALQASKHLAHSMLEAQRAKLELLAYDYSWWDDAVENLVEAPDPVWADDNIGSYQHDTNRLAATFVLAPDDRTTLSFVEGGASRRDAYRYFGQGLRPLVQRARSAAPEEPEPVSGYLRVGDRIQLVSVAALTPENPDSGAGSAPARGILIFSVALDAAFLLEGGKAYGLDSPDIEPARSDALEQPAALVLSDPSGQPLGVLSWRQDKPGSDLALGLAPALAAIVIAMATLLALFYRRAERVLAKEASLLSSLHHERELTSLKADIMTVLAHELKLPLSHVRGAVAALDRDVRQRGETENRREIDDMRHAVARIDRWIDNAMVLGRPDAGFKPMALERVGLLSLVRGAWDETRYLTDASRPFLFAHEADRAETLGDAFLLRAALVNVLENAIKFSGPGDPIEAQLTDAGCHWEISVRDHGPGIPPGEQDAIFEPFRRASGTRSIPGSGLGLGVARSMIERSGGSVSATNHPEGGALFTIRLPKAPPAGA